VRVTIEPARQPQTNEMSSVAYWYQFEPQQAVRHPPVAQRQPIKKDESGKWILDPANQTPR